MDNIIYDKRKITITYKDLFIGERIKTRDELCEYFGMTYKKLRGMGGYERVLKDFGLEPPSQYAKENERKKEETKKFIIEFFKKNGRNPMIKEVVAGVGINEQFLKHTLGGYRKFVEGLGIKHYKPNTGNHLYDMTKEDFVRTFTNAYKETPTVRQFLKTRTQKGIPFGVDVLVNNFGSYENFLIECGMDLNSGIYSRASIAKDGHVCDSYCEREIDDFLFDNGIQHKTHQKYKDFVRNYKGRQVCDFVLSDGTIVEYFGLIGQPKYDKKVKKKVNILEKNNINYIAIYPKDLKDLKVIFRDYLGGEHL